MSTNAAALEALALPCDHVELRYFALVQIRYASPSNSAKTAVSRRGYLAVGKHAVYLVKKDLSGLINNGQIYYAHLEAVVDMSSS